MSEESKDSKSINLKLAQPLADRVTAAAEADERPVTTFLQRLIRDAMDAIDDGTLKPKVDWLPDYRELIDAAKKKEK